MNPLFPRDIIFAAVLVFVSGLTVSVLASRFISLKQGQVSDYQWVAFGEECLLLKGQGKTFGAINSDFKKVEDNLILKQSGQFKYKLKGEIRTGKYTGEGYFNLLGQLGGSILTVSVDGVGFKLGTTGINPIKVIVSDKNSKISFRKEIKIPGPFLLKAFAKDKYRFYHKDFETLSSTGLRIFDQPLLNNLNFELYHLPAESCETVKLSPINLTSTIEALAKLPAQLGVGSSMLNFWGRP